MTIADIPVKVLPISDVPLMEIPVKGLPMSIYCHRVVEFCHGVTYC